MVAKPGLTAAARTVVCIVQPFDWRIYIAPVLILISAGIAIFAMLMQRNAVHAALYHPQIDDDLGHVVASAITRVGLPSMPAFILEGAPCD